MKLPILSADIRYEQDTVHARQRARQVAKLLGFDSQDQTRISTAVSEIARNAFNYANGGKIEFAVEGRARPQLFVIRVTDHGPGIRDLDTILEGRYESPTGMGLGVIGARRLMDQFQINTAAGIGTEVVLTKLIPRRSPLFSDENVPALTTALARERPQDAIQELQHQNQELVRALEEIRTRQHELTRLNRELEDTNRGVVALYAELEEKADHLRRADDLKSKFLSNMSHEFRSPLNSIMALTGLLANLSDGPLTGEQSQQVAYIRRAAQDLLELVNDLLDLAKVEAGKLDARPIEFEVSNLFAALRGMLRPLLLNQSVDLVFEEADGIPPLFTDEGKTSQVLRNFISNALKFTERGEVRVCARMAGDDEVLLSVADTGIGIAPADQELIFQDFVQIEHPIQRRFKGTGLGLPLSKKLATFLGGSVELQSEPGRGSTFTLRIPRIFPDSAPARDAELPPGTALDSSSGRPVLVIEDNPESILTYQSYFRDSGFRMVAAATTREAEKALEHIEVSEKSWPCAIILDIVLRSEDTWGLMASLKKDPRTRAVPIIVASTIEEQAKGFHLGADAYLVKPIERADLLNQLAALTGDASLTRVLIIDDNDVDRYLLRQHLRNLPVMIIEESAGLPGIMRAAASHPDLIFLDLSMPDMTGFEVLDQLKGKPETGNIPVVIVTSRSLQESDRQRLVNRGADIIRKDKLSSSILGEAVRRSRERAGVNSALLNDVAPGNYAGQPDAG
ncbi:MAG TPA: ATP-binding protein [Bryobacteraceae bacterium]|jgi:signal transduction histidine kinase/response regulator RpfG family c-di-GMP phosphodiesterase|nr:ATP-binding protein [Bryobacteraceae bacterium]